MRSKAVVDIVTVAPSLCAAASAFLASAIVGDSVAAGLKSGDDFGAGAAAGA